MPSESRRAFSNSIGDVERLLEIHTLIGGTDPGRRYQLEVLNKSAIVLITAIWEAYCEDIVAEAVEHIITHSPSADALSKEIRNNVAKELKQDKNQLAIWELADAGWRNVLSKRTKQMQEERNRKLNTPKSGQLKELFNRALGISDITDAWHWRNMNCGDAVKKLDGYVELRGAIAHRGALKSAVTKDNVVDYLNHVDRLVRRTGGRVNLVVKELTHTSLW